MTFSLRFDFRNPAFAGTAMADRYAAALDMVEWGDRLGARAVLLSEHHGAEDGYIPSPAVIMGAMAARSHTVRFLLAALIAPFHDPLRIAEDFAVLDNLTRGRVDLVVAAGYAPHEFAMFDVARSERAKRVTEMVLTLKAAFTGEPFDYRGRTVRITPAPYTPGGPRVMLGGSSEPAARRAARIADGFVPGNPDLWDFYRDELRLLGRPDPGPNAGGDASQYVLAQDPDAAWPKMAPYFMHETESYGRWQQSAADAGASHPYHPVETHDELRATNRYRVVTPAEMIALMQGPNPVHPTLHPLCGGMPIDLAWESLRLFEEKVLPAL